MVQFDSWCEVYWNKIKKNNNFVLMKSWLDLTFHRDRKLSTVKKEETKAIFFKPIPIVRTKMGTVVLLQYLIEEVKLDRSLWLQKFCLSP